MKIFHLAILNGSRKKYFFPLNTSFTFDDEVSKMMNNMLTVTEAERDMLVKIYNDKISTYFMEIRRLEDAIRDAEKRVEELKSTFLPFPNLVPIKYHADLPLYQKVQYVLNDRQRIATTRILATRIAILDNLNEEAIRKLTSSIGATLIQKVEKDEIFNRKEFGGTLWYGLKEWFVDNELQPQYFTEKLRIDKELNDLL